MAKVPARTPVRPPAWAPDDPRYWDPRDLEQELRRTFQVCHECRMCVTYCGSFPLLFDAIDKRVDAGSAEGAETLDAPVFADVSNHCWQCKLCYIKCPYTSDESAAELLDFPRLMAREKAQRARRDGIPIVDRVLGEPQLLGLLGSGPAAPLANFVNARALVRKVTERVTGISSRFPLPPMAREPFGRWFSRREAVARAGTQGKIVLFATCYGEYNFPLVPRAAVLALEHNGFEVHVPQALTCCGMPNLDGGDIEAARAKMEQNVDALLPYVRRGMKIVVTGPTCSYSMRKEWPTYLVTPEAGEIAAATLDLMEFFDRLRREKKLDKGFVRGYGKVAYHAACHLRAQKIAIPGARVLSQLPDTEVRIVERCSAVDGTWGMKAEFYDEGARYASKLDHALNEGRNEGERLVVSDCSLAALRVLEQSGRYPPHPAVALAAAYGLLTAEEAGLTAFEEASDQDEDEYEEEP